jgi:hypothetical protein
VAFLIAREGTTMNLRWNELLRALVLVRLGQELGTESRLATAIHDAITMLLALAGIWS